MKTKDNKKIVVGNYYYFLSRDRVNKRKIVKNKYNDIGRYEHISGKKSSRMFLTIKLCDLIYLDRKNAIRRLIKNKIVERDKLESDLDYCELLISNCNESIKKYKKILKG